MDCQNYFGGSGMEGSSLETQGPVHLDTVRALHQTVVSLRTALEVSKNELKALKNKYEKHSQCIEYSDVIEKLTLENHILRRKIIDSGYPFEDPNVPSIKLEVTYSPRSPQPSEKDTDVDESDIFTKTATEDSNLLEESRENSSAASDTEEVHATPELEEEEISKEISSGIEEESVVTKPDKPKSSFTTKLELLSKFDVEIKVRTVKEGADSSSTSEADSLDKQQKYGSETDKNVIFEEHREHFNNTEDQEGHIVIKTFSSEDVKMAVPLDPEAKRKSDKFDVQVRITSEENLVVNEAGERTRRKDTMNLDVDDLSLRSLSEGDNSVFCEGVVEGESRMDSREDKRFDQDNASGNESEEVDDIELIFTTDESKDMSNLQEDLVPLKESDWGPSPTSTSHSTPVLIKFHTLDPDFQPGNESDNFDKENQENINSQSNISDTSLKCKRVSLPTPSDKEIKQVKLSFGGKNLDMGRPGILKTVDRTPSKEGIFKRSLSSSARKLDSVDSLSYDYTKGLSFDTKSSSYDLGSSMDILNRDESLDNFQKNAHLGHRFSIFAESDISKCGISEDDLMSANLNTRRNTCPNPFQYRPLPQRGYSRPPGPFKATVTSSVGRTRPILRGDNYSVRKENGAQTEVSALPNRWSSDGYLAHKVGVNRESVLPTLPRPTVPPSRRLTVAETRPTLAVPRANDSRRVLLSDIGFTSMVPELSRSADPLWVRGTCNCPCNLEPQNTSKFLSRGSYRSPCLSIDRSSDFIAHGAYFKEHRAWRSSLPDVRNDDTDELLDEAEVYLRRSIDNLRSNTEDSETETRNLSSPYLPAEPRHLRLGHAVKVITPQGRIAVGRVRYVGLAGSSSADSCIMVGAIFPLTTYPWIPLNDGTHRGRRYFHAPPHHTALFVPFTKVVMAWAN